MKTCILFHSWTQTVSTNYTKANTTITQEISYVPTLKYLLSWSRHPSCALDLFGLRCCVQNQYVYLPWFVVCTSLSHLTPKLVQCLSFLLLSLMLNLPFIQYFYPTFIQSCVSSFLVYSLLLFIHPIQLLKSSVSIIRVHLNVHNVKKNVKMSHTNKTSVLRWGFVLRMCKAICVC